MMQTITLVTGNKGKLAEWQRMFPKDIRLESADIDLEEIQSTDLVAIAIDKARRAYEILGKPVLVEDVSAGLDELGGLPGPFIKYFELAIGMDAIYKMGSPNGSAATVTCTIVYYNGHRTIIGQRAVKGTTTATRGENGFGFDRNFVPSGQAKTYGEMTHDEKDALSHRSLALRDLVPKLQKQL